MTAAKAPERGRTGRELKKCGHKKSPEHGDGTKHHRGGEQHQRARWGAVDAPAQTDQALPGFCARSRAFLRPASPSL